MSGNLQGSFYKIATDISKGFLIINVVMLKKVPPTSLKSIYFELQKELNMVRSSVIPAEEDLIREKNLKISRIASAMRLIDNYCRKNRIIR